MDAIGEALKKRAIDFKTASELSNIVKAGQTDDALKRLKYQDEEAN